jgi:hypothetical protein
VWHRSTRCPHPGVRHPCLEGGLHSHRPCPEGDLHVGLPSVAACPCPVEGLRSLLPCPAGGRRSHRPCLEVLHAGPPSVAACPCRVGVLRSLLPCPAEDLPCQGDPACPWVPCGVLRACPYPLGARAYPSGARACPSGVHACPCPCPLVLRACCPSAHGLQACPVEGRPSSHRVGGRLRPASPSPPARSSHHQTLYSSFAHSPAWCIMHMPSARSQENGEEESACMRSRRAAMQVVSAADPLPLSTLCLYPLLCCFLTAGCVGKASRKGVEGPDEGSSTGGSRCDNVHAS